MKKYFPLLSSIFIIIAFFLWYAFWNEKKAEWVPNEKNIVSIETKKTKLSVTKSSDDIEIYVDWVLYNGEK